MRLSEGATEDVGAVLVVVVVVDAATCAVAADNNNMDCSRSALACSNRALISSSLKVLNMAPKRCLARRLMAISNRLGEFCKSLLFAVVVVRKGLRFGCCKTAACNKSDPKKGFLVGRVLKRSSAAEVPSKVGDNLLRSLFAELIIVAAMEAVKDEGKNMVGKDMDVVVGGVALLVLGAAAAAAKFQY